MAAPDLRGDLAATPIRVVLDRGAHEELVRFLHPGSPLASVLICNGAMLIGKWIVSLPLADADAILALPTVYARCFRAARAIEAKLQQRRACLLPMPAVAAAILADRDQSQRRVVVPCNTLNAEVAS